METIFDLTGSCLYYLDRSVYKSVIDHPDYRYLADLINELKSSRGNQEVLTDALNSMCRTLNRLFDIECDITIIDNDSGKFFGCDVFPAIHPSEKIAWEMVNMVANHKSSRVNAVELWLNCGKWQIDLDSKILYDNTILFNANDIIAMITFNIENVVYNARPAELCLQSLLEKLATQPIAISKFVQASICRRFFTILLVLACRTKSYPYKATELLGGSCLKTNEHLNMLYKEMVRKMVLFAGNENIDIPPRVIGDQLNHATECLLACVSNMRYSTKMIRSMVEKLLIMEKSPHVSTLLSNILIDIGDYNRGQIVSMERMGDNKDMLELNDTAVKFQQNRHLKNAENLAKEQFEKIATESMLSLLDGIGAMKKVSQKDIDMIRVYSQKIRDADDKFYVLDDVHSKLEIVEASIAMLDSKDPDKVKRVKVPRQTLLDQKKQLDAIREDILKMNPEESKKTLMIHVNYPKGYEG